MLIPKAACLIVICYVLATSSAFAQQIFAAPVPAQILSAKKIFVTNGGDDNFSPKEIYTGEAYRAYNQLYGAFQTSQRFQLVATPSQADLVAEVSTQAVANAQDHLRLTVYDAKTHYVLWRMDSWIDVAARQASRDHNFDLAVTRLESNLEKLAAPPQP